MVSVQASAIMLPYLYSAHYCGTNHSFLLDDELSGLLLLLYHKICAFFSLIEDHSMIHHSIISVLLILHKLQQQHSLFVTVGRSIQHGCGTAGEYHLGIRSTHLCDLHSLGYEWVKDNSITLDMERVLLILGSEERDTIAIKEKEGTIAHTHTHTHTHKHS